MNWGMITWQVPLSVEPDTYNGKPLFKAIVNHCKENNIAGATVIRGIYGYGASSTKHSSRTLALSQDLPIIIEIIDTMENIEKILPDIEIGDIVVQNNDSDGNLVNAINAVKDQTGVEASIDNRGRLQLNSIDGRGMKVEITSGASHAGIKSNAENYGRLTLTRLDARDIKVSGGSGVGITSNTAEATINLRTIRGGFSADQASAIGAHANANVENTSALGSGVTTLKGAMAVMDIAEAAQKALDKIRSDLGSVQNQLVSTINNISVTQVNVSAAESQIRDVDFASESANFNKHNLLAQSGSYAMSQANATQQNVMRLLQ
jgi:flagellin